MSKKPKSCKNNNRCNQVSGAEVLGNTRLSSFIRKKLVHPDATPLHQIPKDNDIEVVLSKMENLLGKGHFGAALREIDALKTNDYPVDTHYEFIRQEKISRANTGIADRYFVRSDKRNARRFYNRAVHVETTNTTIKGVAELTEQVFNSLMRRRKGLVRDLRTGIREGSFEQLCGNRKELHDFTFLDIDAIRERISPDFHLEQVFGEQPSIDPNPGYIDPLPPESEFIAFASTTPGSLFKAIVDVDLESAGGLENGGNNRIRASVAMPIIANVMVAKAHLFALDEGLTLTGQANGMVPLFRNEYLRDKAKQIIVHLQQIESRMLPIQFELDNFAEVVDAIRRPLAEQETELEAFNQRIKGLTQTLVESEQAEIAIAEVVSLFHDAKDECECDWWCWMSSAAIVVFGAAVAVVITSVGGPVAVAAIIAGAITGFSLGLNIATFTCQNVGEITNNLETALSGIRRTNHEIEAELVNVLTLRDVLIANISALSHELSETYQSNEARVLDAKTLDAIQAQYNLIRQSLLTRAQVIARQAEDAFNFERDSDVHLIKDAYYDEDRKGYTSTENLLRDIDGLDYIDITGRTQKSMQLSHTVSLKKHYPMSYIALKTTNRARFTTKLKEFDRWFPGTYMQRIKEVRVEVLVEGKPVLARGYISNDGVSFVRIHDFGDKRKVDNVDIFPEPDKDVAKLCYKRLQRRRHLDTMAFPDFNSYLHKERMRNLQKRERNYFENVGLESTWIIELLPDQPFELSDITDVRVHFQYEAFFDENLRHVLEQNRYIGRREMSAIPIRKILEKEGKVVDLSDTIEIQMKPDFFEMPVIEKQIINAGFVVKPAREAHLKGVAQLEVSYEDAPPIQLKTNDNGIVATASDHPAGTGLADLEAMVHGKNINGVWSIKIINLPQGLGGGDIDEIFLLLNYEYTP